MRKLLPLILFISISGCPNLLHAQWNVGAQLRTRTEFRDGHGAPLPAKARPAFFTSQRSRLNVGYSGYRLKLGLALQDVRVWGQDMSTINRSTSSDNNGLMLHEAWGELLFTDTSIKNKSLSVKIGRQELVYDDSRLIGNLDWLQQARRHDAALMKYENKNWQLHTGIAFNQNKENSSGTLYAAQPAGYAANTNGGQMYKSMQFIWGRRKLKKGSLSYLLFTDQFSKYHNDTVNQLPVKIFENHAWSRFTTGFYFTNSFGKLSGTAAGYYQSGHYDSNKKLNAFLLSGSISGNLLPSLNGLLGVDYSSGGSNHSVNRFFDPLYGTPHKFWGLMDYFYAASPFGKSGLVDFYLKTKWKTSPALSFLTELHHFKSASNLTLASDLKDHKKTFGQEIDLVTNYQFSAQVSIEAGYAIFFATRLLTSPAVKIFPTRN